MNPSRAAVQFLKFSCVGFLNSGVHYLLFYILYKLLGVYYLVSSAIGYSCGMVNSYVLNRRWTFKSNDDRIARELSKFLTVNVGSLLTNLGAMHFLVQHARLAPEHSQVAAIAFSILANFLGNNLWTFKPRA